MFCNFQERLCIALWNTKFDTQLQAESKEPSAVREIHLLQAS